MLEVGQVIGGRLRIDRILGIGGFGIVGAATHLELNTQVAVKMLKPEFKHDEEITERFLREARAVAGLETEHVCQVIDVARTDDGDPYIVMELLQGGDVASLMKANPIPQATAVDFIVQACIGLAEAHARGIIHRDLKPPNLFVMRKPSGGGSIIKVLDFGIAKAADELRLTHSMTMLGSPQYMSPEQLTSPRSVDARSDIWSLGVTLYHMIARRLPFPSAQIGELAVMITSQPPQPIECHPELAAVIYRCLEKEPAKRYADVAALAAALAPFGTPTTRGYAAQVRSTGKTPVAITPPPAQPIARHAPTAASSPGMAAAGASHPGMAPHGTPHSASPQVQASGVMTGGAPSAAVHAHADATIEPSPSMAGHMAALTGGTPARTHSGGAPYASNAPAPYAGNAPQPAPYASKAPQAAPYAGNAPQATPYASNAGMAPVVPRRSRAVLWAAIGIVLLGGGVLVGVAMRGSSSRSSTVASTSTSPSPSTSSTTSTSTSTSSRPDPASTSGTSSSSPSGTSPSSPSGTSPSSPSGTSPSSPSSPSRSSTSGSSPAAPPSSSAPSPEQTRFQRELAAIENTMRIHAKDPAMLQMLYVNAVGIACVARDLDKARTYFARIDDAEKRADAAGRCAPYGIRL